jgi:hypothetical protein
MYFEVYTQFYLIFIVIIVIERMTIEDDNTAGCGMHVYKEDVVPPRAAPLQQGGRCQQLCPRPLHCQQGHC